MLAIGRALMTAPRLLLLDEPSLGLSPILTAEVLGRVRAIVARGTAVLLAEQNVAKALEVADRAYVLQVGRVVESGGGRAAAESAHPGSLSRRMTGIEHDGRCFHTVQLRPLEPPCRLRLGALDRLPELAQEIGAKRPAAVLDEHFTRTPVGGRVAALLKEATGAEPLVHAAPAREPDTATVEACAAALAAACPDFILALGGGSAMDTAKVARMLLSNPGPAEAIAGFGKRLATHASVLVAVPTTHGTGSEVSESAVLGKEGMDAKLITACRRRRRRSRCSIRRSPPVRRRPLPRTPATTR